jgi:hypothetical protein
MFQRSRTSEPVRRTDATATTASADPTIAQLGSPAAARPTGATILMASRAYQGVHRTDGIGSVPATIGASVPIVVLTLKPLTHLGRFDADAQRI